MPKIDLRFLDCLDLNDYIKVNKVETSSENKRLTEEKELVLIEGESYGKAFDMYLDKSTAIRFSKALRTAINQIK